MNILGISAYYHDAAAALLRDGMLVAAAEEERFSRRKHDAAFPTGAIDFCLRKGQTTAEELDYVVFYEKPMLRFERLATGILRSFPRSWGMYRSAMRAWFGKTQYLREEIGERLGVSRKKILFVEHHLSHAASAFLCSPFDDAAIVTVDGVGEWTTTTIGRGARQQDGSAVLELLEEIQFPHSLGLLYSAFTAFLGFAVNSGEYKVMGMAPYGRPTRVEDVRKVVQIGDDGAFHLDMRCFDFEGSDQRAFTDRFVDLFGPPRAPDAPFYTERTHPLRDCPGWDDAEAARNQEYADIAASVQQVTEEALLKIAHHAHARSGSKNLCLAGGVALNSVANGRVQREGPFEAVWVQPAAGDSGGAIGAALLASQLLGERGKFVMEHAYWGEDFSAAEASDAVRGRPFSIEEIADPDRRAQRLAEDLAAGRVVALCQGRFEWGPRALGNRSILADPRCAEMKERVNEQIKFREPFRPFAPAVLAERVADLYEGVTPAAANLQRYMLGVYHARPEWVDRIPAVTHVDGTGRVQAVSSQHNSFFHRVISHFHDLTGVPAVLNTSFNLGWEPIVASPRDALNTFGESGLDALYVGDFAVRKQGGQ